jgi:hypothetical protein
MATITRTAVAGAWTALTSWSTAAVPTSADDVVFTLTSAAATPITAGSTVNCQSLTLDSSFTGTVGNTPGTGEIIAIAGKNGAGNSLDISGGQIYPCDVKLNGTTATTVNLSGVNTSAKATFSLVSVGAGPHTLSVGSTGAFINSLTQIGGTFSTNNCNLTISNLVINAGTATFGTSTIAIKSFNSVSTQLYFGTSGVSAPNATFNYTDTAINCTLGFGSTVTLGTLNISSLTGSFSGGISAGSGAANATIGVLSIISTAGGSLGFAGYDGLLGGVITISSSITMKGAAGHLLAITGTGDDGSGPYPVTFIGTPATKVFQYLNLTLTTVNTPTWTAVNSTDGGSNSGWAFTTSSGGGGGSPQLDLCFKLGF